MGADAGGDDALDGGSGADVIEGVSGADLLRGGPGPARIFLGTGASLIHGEDGADILRLNVSHAGQTASGGVRCRLPGGRAGAATRTEILDFVPGVDTLRFDGIKIDPWSPRAGAIWR